MEQQSSMQKRNREKLVDYFSAGISETKNLGFELEHILLHKNALAPVSYTEAGGVHDILERLAPAFSTVAYENESIVGLSREKAAISIEPAGQLEISVGPFSSVAEIEEAYLQFRSQLDPILSEFGLCAPMLGYHPTSRAQDLELIPKFRYQCMNDFLGKQSPFGVCMMRASASVQVSIDFCSEQDAMRKLRISEILAPIFSLMCDNSPIFEAEARATHLVRSAMWAGMNQDRVGCVPGSLEPGFNFARYADYIMTREAILAPGKEAGSWEYVGATTFDELYAEREMAEAEIEHALSMVWPDTRLKNFIEIRPADAMPLEYALAYTVLIGALFYHAHNLDALDAALGAVTEEDVAAAKTALMEAGYSAVVYGKPASYWADLLISLAQECAGEGEEAYLAPLESLVRARHTLAQDWPQEVS